MQAAGLDRPCFARARGEQHERSALGVGSAQHPFAIGRNRSSIVVAEADSRRSISLADVDRILGAAPVPLLIEHEPAAVRSKTTFTREVQPGEVALLGAAGGEPHHDSTRVGLRQQYATIAGNVEQNERARYAENRPHPAGETP